MQRYIQWYTVSLPCLNWDGEYMKKTLRTLLLVSRSQNSSFLINLIVFTLACRLSEKLCFEVKAIYYFYSKNICVRECFVLFRRILLQTKTLPMHFINYNSKSVFSRLFILFFYSTNVEKKQKLEYFVLDSVIVFWGSCHSDKSSNRKQKIENVLPKNIM